MKRSSENDNWELIRIRSNLILSMCNKEPRSCVILERDEESMDIEDKQLFVAIILSMQSRILLLIVRNNYYFESYPSNFN